MRTLVTIMAVALLSASLAIADSDDPTQTAHQLAAAGPPQTTSQKSPVVCRASNSEGDQFKGSSAELAMNSCMINTPPGEICYFNGCS